MKILFVQPSAGFLVRGTTYPVCRSIMTTASYMKSIGHEVLVHDRCIDFRDFSKAFSFSPDLVMFYIPPSALLEEAIKLSDYSKKHGATVVWGEVIASSLSEQAIERGCADFVIIGETETKLELLINELNSNKDFSKIPGLTYKRNGLVITNENQNCSPLSALPSIDWELIDVEKCFRAFPHCKKMLYMYTSRGCPYKCTYCYNTMFYNSEHRKRPIHFVLEEIKHLEKKYGLDGVNFSDELLLLNDDEISQIAAFRKENKLNFVWGGEIRADSYKTIESLQKMYDAGCRWFLLGLETGSEEMRNRIKKPMSNDLIKTFVDNCTRVGISTFGSFIIGFPGETEEMAKDTAEFALTLNLDAFLFNYYIPIPKTPLGDDLIRNGMLDVSDLFDSVKPAQQTQSLSKNYSEISSKDMLVIKSFFDWLTFTRKKAESTNKGMFIKKAFDAVKHFAEGNISNSLKNLCSAAKTFLTVVIYSTFFPGIRKKYNLIKPKKDRKT